MAGRRLLPPPRRRLHRKRQHLVAAIVSAFRRAGKAKPQEPQEQPKPQQPKPQPKPLAAVLAPRLPHPLAPVAAAKVSSPAALAPPPPESYIPGGGSYTVNYEELKRPKEQLPRGVDPDKREEYLTDHDFLRVLGSPRSVFGKLKQWKQRQLKRAAGLG